MKKISNISQTYGNFRHTEIDCVANKDIIGHNIRKQLDLHTFTFHNCHPLFMRQSMQMISSAIPNTTYFISNNKPYGQTIRKTLNALKDKGMTDILFLQDDQFCPYSETNLKIINLIFDWYKNGECQWLDLYGDRGKQIPPFKEEIIKDNLVVRYFDSMEFQKVGLWGYSDGCYMADIQFLLDNFFTADKDDLHTWKLEEELNEITKKKSFTQCSTNANLFLTLQQTGINVNKIPILEKIDFFFNNKIDKCGDRIDYKKANEGLIL